MPLKLNHKSLLAQIYWMPNSGYQQLNQLSREFETEILSRYQKVGMSHYSNEEMFHYSNEEMFHNSIEGMSH